MNTNNQNPAAARTLAGLLKARGTLSQTQILSLLQPVIATLSKMHSQGLVHGHISPDTILLRDSSLLLFTGPLPDKYKEYLGQSLSRDEKERLGYTAFLGTPDVSETSDDCFDAYRAPETYISSIFFTPAADVYSLCAVIYTAVTGCVPEHLKDILFNPETKSVCNIFLQSKEDKNDNAVLSARHISNELKCILQKGVSLLPKNRYADMSELNKNLAFMAENIFSVLDGDFLESFILQVQKNISDFNREKIKTISFLNTTKGAPHPNYDISSGRNNSIIAWISPANSKKFHVYIASEGGVKAGQSCDEMFAGCTALEKINFGNNFDTSNVTTMRGMFMLCEALKSLDLSHFKTSNVTDMYAMFCCCFELKTLNIKNFDTSHVTDMTLMFMGNYRLNADISSDIAAFDMTCVKHAAHMLTSTPLEQELLPLELHLSDHENFDISNDTQVEIYRCCKKFSTDYSTKFQTQIYSIHQELKETLGLTDAQRVYLSCDTSASKNSTAGFAVTDRGIFNKSHAEDHVQQITYSQLKAAKRIFIGSDQKLWADAQLLADTTNLAAEETSYFKHLFTDIKSLL